MLTNCVKTQVFEGLVYEFKLIKNMITTQTNLIIMETSKENYIHGLEFHKRLGVFKVLLENTFELSLDPQCLSDGFFLILMPLLKDIFAKK